MAKFGTQTRAHRVQDMCWYTGRRYENNDIFLTLRACRPRLLLRCALAMGWSVGP